MEQTNRTILFEEINPEKINLIELIGEIKEKESLEDAIVDRIRKELTVDSYEMALEKFAPSIYLYLDTQSCFMESTVTGTRELTTIPLTGEWSLLDKLVHLMQVRDARTYGLENVSEILSNLFLEKEYDSFSKLRLSVFEACLKSETAAEKKLEQLWKQYDESFFLLIAFINEANRFFSKENQSQAGIILGEDKKIQIDPVAVSPDMRQRIPKCLPEQREKYIQFIKTKLQEAEQQKTVKNARLLEELLLMIVEKEKVEIASFTETYQRVRTLYIAAVKLFWKQAKPLIQTMLGIREFFHQYEVIPPIEKTPHRRISITQEEKVIEEMRPVLLISNCRADILQQEENRNRLRIFLETVNEKNFYNSTIWYAIVPGVNHSEWAKNGIRERFAVGRENIEYASVSKEEAFTLVDILSEYDIQSFISLECNTSAGFQKLKNDGIENFEKAFAFFDQAEKKEFLVPCFPNFTVVPERYMYFEVAEASDTRQKIWLDGVWIEASYVAAGLVAACQCPAYLTRFYKENTDAAVPGVAYCLSKDGHEKRTVTTMSREILSLSEEVVENALRRSRGVLFLPEGGKIIAATDRAYSYKEGMKDNISMIQTLTYLKRKIRYATQDYKEGMIKEFFQNRPGSMKSQWAANGKCVNAIIKNGEELKCNIDTENKECTFIMEYPQVSKQNTVRIN